MGLERIGGVQQGVSEPQVTSWPVLKKRVGPDSGQNSRSRGPGRVMAQGHAVTCPPVCCGQLEDSARGRCLWHMGLWRAFIIHHREMTKFPSQVGCCSSNSCCFLSALLWILISSHFPCWNLELWWHSLCFLVGAYQVWHTEIDVSLRPWCSQAIVETAELVRGFVTTKNDARGTLVIPNAQIAEQLSLFWKWCIVITWLTSTFFGLTNPLSHRGTFPQISICE